MKASRRAALAILILFACSAPAMAQAGSRPKPRPKAAEPAPPKKPAAPPAPTPAPASVTVATRYAAGGDPLLTTLHSSGSRQRFEFAAGRTLIVQCDAGKAIQVSDVAKSYTASTLKDATAPEKAGGDETKGGPVTFRTTITDTGERREMFGLPARRVMTVTAREPSASACDKSRTRVETDGWYADLPVAMHCGAATAAVTASDKPECADEAHTETIGEASALGYALSYTTTTKADTGKVLSTTAMEVTALTVHPVERALYEVPPGYTELSDTRALVRAEMAARGVAPKRAGAVRIGVVLPRNSSDAAISADALNTELLDALAVSPHEPIALDASETTAAVREAMQKECDYLLFTDLLAAKTTTAGRFGRMMNKVSREEDKDTHQAKVRYLLLATVDQKPVLEKTETASSGGGVNVRSALRVARVAARLYIGLNAGIMQAVLSNAQGGAPATDPMLGALDMVLKLGDRDDAPARTLEGIVAMALRAQSASVIKAITKP